MCIRDSLRFASSKEQDVPGPIINNGGWHFSYLGGYEAIIYKLKSHPFQGYKVQLASLLSVKIVRRLVIEFSNTCMDPLIAQGKKRKLRSHYFKAFRDAFVI